MAAKHHTLITKLTQRLSLRIFVTHYAHLRQTTVQRLCAQMKVDEGFLHRRMLKGDMLGAELVLLGNTLEANPFEPYLSLLNPTCRATHAETELTKRIADLEKQLEAVSKERDWLKTVVEKR
jgi:hypothetical protein